MDKVLLAAAQDGRFDVMLPVYNFIQKEMGESVLKACREKNIGTTLMKTNPVGNYLAMKSRAEEMKSGMCQKNCPYGVPIHGLLTMAHENLSLA